MNLKTAIYILGALLLSTLGSCLNGNDNSDVVYSTDAQIISFSIKNDTIDKSLSAIKFSIDQLGNLIYNKDSANYGIALTEKVIVTFSTANGMNTLLNKKTNGDSVWVKSGDSIDLAKPVTLWSYAINGDKKKYTVKLNIHTVDPDAIWWRQVNSGLDFLNHGETKTFLLRGTFYCFSSPNEVKLNTSNDYGVTWIEHEVKNLPPDVFLSQIQAQGDSLLFAPASFGLYTASIKDTFTLWTQVPQDFSKYLVRNVLGIVAGKNVLALAVAKENGSIISATYNGNKWEYGDELSDKFPAMGFSSISYTRANTGFLTITGGTYGTSWTTTDGLHWVKIGDLPSNMSGSNVFRYDDKFYLLNGIVNTFNNKSVYTSIDGTVTWQLAPSKTNFPGNYTLRAGASVVVSSDNMIYIIGGKNESNPVTDIWEGRLNKLN